MKKLRILLMNRQSSAVAYYRSWVPARILRARGHEVTAFEDSTYQRSMKPTIEKWMQERFGQFDLIHSDRAVEWDAAAKVAGFKHYSPGARLIVDFDDDFTNVPWWNTAHGTYQPGQEHREAGLGNLRLAEMTTVSTEALRATFASKAHAIEVAPNFLDPTDWEGHPVNPDRPKDPHVRVLYGGASGHFGDMDDARKGLEAVLENPPVPFRLICFGAIPFWMHEMERKYPGRLVSLPWVHFMQYPKTVAWGGFDIAIAPLKDHIFNLAKCLVPGTRVVTNPAVKTIESISTDDKVLLNGRYRPVAAAVEYKNQETVQITTKRGYCIGGTPHHKILSSGKFAQLKDLPNGSKVDLSFFEFKADKYVEYSGPWLMTKKLRMLNKEKLDSAMLPSIRLNEDWGQFFGVVLGDGCISSFNSVTISCTAKDSDVVSWLSSFGERIGLSKPRTITTGGCTTVTLNSRNLQLLLRENGLGEGQTRKKKLAVPEFIWKSPESVVASFIRGLFEADGTCSKGVGISWCTKSESLAKDIQILLLGFGILTTRRQYLNKTYRKTYHLLNLSRQACDQFKEKIGFMSRRKNKKLTKMCSKLHSNAYKSWTLEDMVETQVYGYSDVYDIQVPDGEAYIANGFISHNSNIKWLESGIQRIAFLCSNVGPYASIPDGCALKVENTPVQWAEGLRRLLLDASERKRLSDAAYDAVKASGTVDSAGKVWDHIIEATLARPRIETLEDTFLPSQSPPPA